MHRDVPKQRLASEQVQRDKPRGCECDGDDSVLLLHLQSGCSSLRAGSCCQASVGMSWKERRANMLCSRCDATTTIEICLTRHERKRVTFARKHAAHASPNGAPLARFTSPFGCVVSCAPIGAPSHHPRLLLLAHVLSSCSRGARSSSSGYSRWYRL